jgi:hypothetical protein
LNHGKVTASGGDTGHKFNIIDVIAQVFVILKDELFSSLLLVQLETVLVIGESSKQTRVPTEVNPRRVFPIWISLLGCNNVQSLQRRFSQCRVFAITNKG